MFTNIKFTLKIITKHRICGINVYPNNNNRPRVRPKAALPWLWLSVTECLILPPASQVFGVRYTEPACLLRNLQAACGCGW